MVPRSSWPRYGRTVLLLAVAVTTVVTLMRLYPRSQLLPPAPPATPRPAATAAANRVPSPTPAPRARPTPGPVDLNRATREELLALPGIGEVRATRIIASREQDGPFRAPDDLVTRRIVPRAVFDRIKDRLIVP